MFGKAQALFAPLMLLVAALTLYGCNAPAAGDQNPNLETAKANAKECVEPTADIRRNHMEYLLHERDETMYEGIRGSKHSFKECINCHVPAEKDGKPVNYLKDDHSTLNPDHFCATCHSYVSVKLDCFECHSDNPESAEGVAPASHVAFGTSTQPSSIGTTLQGSNQ